MNRDEEIYVGGFQASDQLDPAESLAGEIGDDPLDAGYSPPEREPVATRWGNTGEEQLRGESLEQHLAEEEPDISEDDLDTFDPYPRVGRLVAPDEGAHPIEEGQFVASDLGPAGWASSAEEAAMHIVADEPAVPTYRVQLDVQGALAGPVHCPACDAATLSALRAGEQTNFRCTSCQHTWQVQLGWVSVSQAGE
jgi:hypothetical protein